MAAAVKIVLEGAWRRRAWVVLVPLALYGLWLLAYGRSGASLSNIAGAPVFVANSLGAALDWLIDMARKQAEREERRSPP